MNDGGDVSSEKKRAFCGIVVVDGFAPQRENKREREWKDAQESAV